MAKIIGVFQSFFDIGVFYCSRKGLASEFFEKDILSFLEKLPFLKGNKNNSHRKEAINNIKRAINKLSKGEER